MDKNCPFLRGRFDTRSCTASIDCNDTYRVGVQARSKERNVEKTRDCREEDAPKKGIAGNWPERKKEEERRKKKKRKKRAVPEQP